ncbi:MAG: lipoprotein-releasing ABC transporter permease subunit [Pelagibacteraceae bacterium]
MFNKVERLISSRNLKPKKKEGFLKVISIFSFLGIMLGVSILIIVMSVMNGFRTELTSKILGFNPHIIIEPYSSEIDENFYTEIKNKYKNFIIKKTFSGEAVLMTNNIVKGLMIKGIMKKEINQKDFLEKNLIEGSIKNFKNNSIIIGKELAESQGLEIGNSINLMSSSFISTPLGSVPKNQTFKISGIFSSGFYEFDQNIVFINLNDAFSFFDKDKKDLNLEIYLDQPIKADFYKNKIELINENYYVRSWTDLNKSFFAALKVERNVMFIILTLIIIVAAFNIISGLTILIKNKTKEIAILKTLGLSNTSITKSFFLTGFTIGFLATICGIIFGIIFSYYIEEIRFLLSSIFNLEIFPADIYLLDKMPSEISFFSIIIIFLFSLIITSIASYFPAKIISKINTLKSLKYE